jgi:hypothetical protein
MSVEQGSVTKESRDLHLDNVKQHIMDGVELDEEAASDLERNPEAFSDLIRILGYGVVASTHGMSSKGATPEIVERYTSMVDAAIEHAPEDSIDVARLKSMKEWVAA